MTQSRTLFQRGGAAINRLMMLPLLRTTWGHRLFGSSAATVRYRGRRSGRDVELIASYRRDGENYVIGVMAPGQKSWWRNFTGDGAPLTLQIGQQVVRGHGIATRSKNGAVRIDVTTRPSGQSAALIS